jgi:hypothetical protein
MSWLKDRIKFHTASSHAAPPVLVDEHCYSNERHHSDLLSEDATRGKALNEDCGKRINELWLSQCAESLRPEASCSETEPEQLTPKQHSDKLLQSIKLRVLRRTSQQNAI